MNASEYQQSTGDGRDTEIVDVVLEPHPNADTLSIQRIGDDVCVVKTDHWAGIDKGVFIHPDGLVDTSRPEFAFLASKARSDGWYRVRAATLRGVKSFGLMVPYTGVDLGVKHWNPPEPRAEPLTVTTKSGRKVAGDPNPIKGPSPDKYDLESGKKLWKKLFTLGEEVVITEKIHGANARFCLHDGRQLCGSRSGWKHERPTLTIETLMAKAPEMTREEADEIITAMMAKSGFDWWWKAFHNDAAIGEFCRANPELLLYGEIYGQSVQGGFPYDSPSGIAFRAFDVMKPDLTMMRYDEREALNWCGVKKVPVLFRGPFDPAAAAELAEGLSTIDGKTLREGVVVESVETGIKLKWVGFGYLSRGKD